MRQAGHLHNAGDRQSVEHRSATVEARDAMARLAATNLSAVLRGEAPPTPVN